MANIETFDRSKPTETVPIVHSFFEWCKMSKNYDAKAAWDYQQHKLRIMTDSLNQVIGNGKELYKEQVDKLKGFIKEDIKLIAELEVDKVCLMEQLTAWTVGARCQCVALPGACDLCETQLLIERMEAKGIRLKEVVNVKTDISKG